MNRMSQLQFPRLRSVSQFAIAVFATAAICGCAGPSLRGNVATPPNAPASPWASHTSVMRWNEYATDLIARNQVGQFPALRTLAYLNLAMNNAIIVARQQGVRAEGAAAGAAATVLGVLYPKDAQSIAARLAFETAALGAKPYRTDFIAGVDVGRAAGATAVDMAAADRFNVPWTGTVPTGDGKWSSRAQPPAPPLGANFPAIRPFFLTTAAEFRVSPPPELNSNEFRATLAEVRKASDGRTYEELRIAQYWEGITGTFNAGFWNAVARTAISERGLGEAESARILAMMHMASLDANLACHDSKYIYWLPRPTQLDPDIRLAIGVPNHPSYPSNHACISGAAGLILDAYFSDARGRYFAMAREAAESRIYGGIHYRIDIDEGFKIAHKVATRALDVGVPRDQPFVPRGQ